MIVFIVSYLVCVLQYMISLVYCIFVVCTNRLICGAQHSKADRAEEQRGVGHQCYQGGLKSTPDTIYILPNIENKNLWSRVPHEKTEVAQQVIILYA
jgi:hypothetical protein